MQYSIEPEENKKLLWIRCSGEASVDDFKALGTKLLNPPYSELPYDIIYDLRQVDLARFTDPDIREIARLAILKRERFGPLKQAIVVNRVSSFGIMRMFETLAELSGCKSFCTFQSYDEAESWIMNRSADPEPDRKTILLVEDEKPLLLLIQRVLEESGFTVLSAGTATEARAVFNEHCHRIDVLLSDIILPDGKGTSLAEQFHASKPDLRILLMSGYTEPNILEDLKTETLFLPKPFHPSRLIESLESLLSTAESVRKKEPSE